MARAGRRRTRECCAWHLLRVERFCARAGERFRVEPGADVMGPDDRHVDPLAFIPDGGVPAAADRTARRRNHRGTCLQSRSLSGQLHPHSADALPHVGSDGRNWLQRRGNGNCRGAGEPLVLRAGRFCHGCDFRCECGRATRLSAASGHAGATLRLVGSDPLRDAGSWRYGARARVAVAGVAGAYRTGAVRIIRNGAAVCAGPRQSVRCSCASVVPRLAVDGFLATHAELWYLRLIH